MRYLVASARYLADYVGKVVELVAILAVWGVIVLVVVAVVELALPALVVAVVELAWGVVAG